MHWSMTAEAFVLDLDAAPQPRAPRAAGRTERRPARQDDPDATWVDLLKGRRGQKMPEAATAFLPAAQTQCLAVVPAAGIPCEATRMGALVPEAPAPVVVAAPAPRLPSGLPEVATVYEYREPVRPASPRPAAPERLPSSALVGVPRGSSLPALELLEALPSSPWTVADGPRPGVRALAGRQAETPAPQLAPAAPQPDPEDGAARADTHLRRSGTPVVRGLPDTPPRRDSGLAQALGTPVGVPVARVLPPNVPTWAACVTQMEGPGQWIEGTAPAPVVAPSASPAVKVVMAEKAQVNVLTKITPLPSQPRVKAKAKSTAAEVVPFALVLVAITLATAALVGAYL
jgi:hypothetical protein